MSSWRPALRIARREALRARGRSALVIAMIALPVGGVVAVDVVFRTDQLSAEQAATRTIGQADGALTDSGLASFDQFATTVQASQQRDVPLTAGELAAALPPGSRSLVDRTRYSVPVVAGEEVTRGELRELAYDDPLAAGVYAQAEGRAPDGPGEAALTRAFADRLGVGVGDVVGLDDPAARLTVVGLLDGASSRAERTLLVDPGALASPATAPGSGGERVLFDLPGELDLAAVRALNEQGAYVEPRAPVPGAPSSGAGVGADELAVVGLVVGMALLEVVLLAGPAFAVGAKRQARQLALVTATGGTSRDVRRTVLGGGIVLGVASAAVGTVLGLAGGAALVAVVDRVGDTVQPPLDVRPLEVLGIALVGLVTAVLASVLPARTASRQDVVAALTGRRGTARTSWRLTGAGLVAAAAGAGLALLGARQRDVRLLLAGSVVAELGLVATTPALVGAAGRLAPLLPVAPRLALRDASRQRSRTAPAVAAVLAAVAGSVAVGTYVTSLDAVDRARYQPQAVDGSVVVSTWQPEDAARLAQVQDALRSSLPVDRLAVLQTANDPDGTTYVSLAVPPARRCPLDDVYAAGGVPTTAQEDAARGDTRCDGSFYADAYGPLGGIASSLPGPVVGDADDLAALDGVRDAATTRALEQGAAVVPAPFVEDGRAHLLVTTTDAGGSATAAREVVVPAVPLPDGSLPFELLSPGAAAALGVPLHDAGVIATTSRTPDGDEEDALLGALRRAGVDASPYVERGYRSSYGLGLAALAGGSALLVLGASGIATGLAAADGRADLSTLAAVGATPGLRRRLAALQSAVTAVLGTVLGVAAGLVPAYGLLVALNADDPLVRYPYLVPWALLGVTVLVVPLLAALAAGALTRSRLPLVRRPA